jgi:hypothetical protein
MIRLIRTSRCSEGLKKIKNKKMKTTTITIISAIFLLCLIGFANALTIDRVSVNPDVIAPGKTADVDISIFNNAEEIIEDVSVSLDLTNVPLAPYDSGVDYTTNEIEDGKRKQAEFKIIALNDAKSGIYKIPVKISYTENSAVKNQQSLISVTVNSQPIIEVSVEDGLLLKGKDNKVSLKTVNKGLGDAKFFEIETKSSTYYNILSASKIYIGDIDSNDFQTAEFNMFFNNNALSRITVPISVKYKDMTNKEYTKDFDVELRVYSQEQAQNLGLVAKSNTSFYVITIVAVIIIFVIYRWFRRRRKRNLEK